MRPVALAICLLLATTGGLAEASDRAGNSSSGIIVSPNLSEPLVKVRGTNRSEDDDLSTALDTYSRRDRPDDLSVLESFIRTHPLSGWNPSVLLNIGLSFRHHGYITRAEEAWRSTWDLGKSAQDPEARALVDRAVGELALLYASLGDNVKLGRLIEEIGSRPISGSATENLQIASETLNLANKDPRHLYNCGPLALRSLLGRYNAPPDQLDALRWRQVGPNGTSMADVAKLASQAGFSYRLIRRELGQPVPVPSVMHFRGGHFAAVLAEENGRYHVFDPVFGGQDLWLTPGAMDSEASGYFLIRKDPGTSSEWRDVALAEADSVWGKGPTNGVVRGDANDPLANGPADPDADPDPKPNCGMCRYDIRESSVGLTLWDIPVGYAPAIGPKVRTRISYNQREDSQPAVFGFYNVSPKWTLNWLTYITDDPQNPGGNVSRTFTTGGAYYYVGYSAGTGSFAAENGDGSVLTRNSDNTVGYKRRLRDGTVEVYSQSDGSVGFPRRIFISTITDPQGNTLTFNYDGQQRLTSLSDALGRETTFGYAQPGRPLLVTQITDPFGRSAKITYDPLGRLNSITDIIGLTSRFTYDANGLVNAMTTPYGTTTFNYTTPGTSSPPRFLDVTDPLGHHEREEWLEPAPIPDSDPAVSVPQGMPVAPVNQYLTYRNSFHWDKEAYVRAGCSVTGGCDYTKARIRHFVHASDNIKGVAIESEKKPLENRVWFNYPGQTSSNFAGSYNEPSAIGRVLDDGTSQISRFDYDTKNYNLTRSIDPLGRTTLYTYAPNGIDILAVTQAAENSTYNPLAQFAYNGQHRPISYTDASGRTATYSYNMVGQLTATTNALNETTKFTYGPTGKLSSIVNANGATSSALTYDAFDRVKTYTDSEGWTSSYDYDLADRITSITFPDGTAQTYTYERLDLVGYRDRQQRTWSYAYDANRQLVSMTDPSGSRSLLDYRAGGKLSLLTDAKGNKTHWEYDVQGRMIAKQYPDSGTTSYIYEPTTSRIKSTTDSLQQIRQFSYSTDNRLSGIHYINSVNYTPNVAFVDDPYYPRTHSMSDGIGITTYTYAPAFTPGASELSGECLTPAGGGTSCAWTIAYSYDALGRMASRTVSGSGPETTAYDTLGRVANRASDLGTFEFNYLGETRQPILRKLLPITQALKTQWNYLPNSGDRRLSGVLNSGLSVGQYLNIELESTPENLVSRIVETSDAPIINPSSGSQTASVNTLNQLTSVDGQTLTYDANGNLLSDGRRSFAWDAENRIVRIDYIDQPGKVSTFAYDGYSRRAMISAVPAGGGAAAVTNYVWCGTDICQSRTPDGVVLRSYTAEGEFLPGSPAQRYFYGVDQIGSVRRVFASSGSAPQSTYDPYGSPLQSTASGADFGFAGMFYHADSGLYLTQYRAYDPTVGRWLSRDPLGEFASPLPDKYAISTGGAWNTRSRIGYFRPSLNGRVSDGSLTPNGSAVNLYQYASSNPVNLRDPSGLAVSCPPAISPPDPLVDSAGTPRTGVPWSMVETEAGRRYRFYDGNGNADYDIELPGDHAPFGPAWHGWSNGVRTKEFQF